MKVFDKKSKAPLSSLGGTICRLTLHIMKVLLPIWNTGSWRAGLASYVFKSNMSIPPKAWEPKTGEHTMVGDTPLQQHIFNPSINRSTIKEK